MTSQEVELPFLVFPDIDGQPLSAGFIYVGEENQDPTTTPINVFWDRELTIPADQPIRTLNGFLDRNGSPGSIHIAEIDYSITVQNRNGAVIHSKLSASNETIISYTDYVFDDVAALINRDGIPSDSLVAGATVRVLSRGLNVFNIQSSGSANAMDVIDINGGLFAVLDLNNTTNLMYALGAIGSTDNSGIIARLEVIKPDGYVISGGVFPTATVLIEAPIRFDPDGAISANAGGTVTIRNKIDAGSWFILRGDGSYVFEEMTDQGEQSRIAHAAWFGAFPYPGINPVDQAPFINKAFASMGNGRESILDFDIGNYTLRTQVTVTRGGWVRGAGTRRTVFLHDSDGFDSFVTDNVACKFTGIQFEIDLGAISTRVNAFIRISHGECEIYDVNAGQTEKGIIVNANNCRIKNMLAVYGSNQAAGSSLVLIEGGSSNTVKEIQCNTSSAFGPTTVVEVGGPTQTGTISSTVIEDVSSILPSFIVNVDAQLGNISRTIIEGARYNGFAGTPPSTIIQIKTSSTFDLDDVLIDRLLVNSFATSGIRLEQGSSGTMKDIMIDGSIISGSSGNGIELIRTAGVLMKVRVGSTVDVSERPTPFLYSGTSIQQVRVSPSSFPNTAPAYCYDFTIEDDEFSQIDLNRSVFTGYLVVTVGTLAVAQYVPRAAVSPGSLTITSTVGMQTATIPLTGTTGVDGAFTTGFTDGVLYFENRLGSSQRVNVILCTGVI